MVFVGHKLGFLAMALWPRAANHTVTNTSMRICLHVLEKVGLNVGSHAHTCTCLVPLVLIQPSSMHNIYGVIQTNVLKNHGIGVKKENQWDL